MKSKYTIAMLVSVVLAIVWDGCQRADGIIETDKHQTNNENMIIGYARVSTQKQSLLMQEEALGHYGCDRIFSEKKSGKNTNREQFKLMMQVVREGDTVVVHSLSRLGRSLKDILNVLDKFRENDIQFVAITENIKFDNTAMGRLQINVFGMLAQLQRDLTSEKTKAGLEAARRAGRVGGRPRGLSKDAQRKAKIVATMYKSGDHSVRQICDTVGIAVSTLYNYLRHEKVKVGSHSKKLMKLTS